MTGFVAAFVVAACVVAACVVAAFVVAACVVRLPTCYGVALSRSTMKISVR